ncbi:alanine/glycine:cation symporter family protein [Cyclobacterium marinum]|uniref:Amino acid carrier protein n=1 Tax=Cyclobacterium marinum (strain ATCC 25205 / DSM 745 / LMG 13164 / NCIMB 1802) TaxID=880070 RepID=G0J6F2_CYCMS|nr:alanine/glycine:cation symporter family protein [Cyclobacterium marinum]AEL27647.1 amino acid carrier protein [Cyclobacterium marinum DSM 745]MBI0397419.1 alanine:cation symporter family protein [Cyclobacterium marinum]MBR9775409.1 alanine:cation symporter family protein [Cytophagales bacterium]|tara:strand:+ start:46182 stop:47612 length:1431 start_codon:yes stop_codon:yes gene_type:complete
MESIIHALNNIIWSNALIVLCLGVGIYFSFVTKFLQIRYFKEMIKLLFGGESSDKGVTSFQAFAIAISGRVGTGNIAGVATAIAMGGPGAIFWMWIIAFLGSASAFIEATLGQMFKEVKDGQYRGGPAFYIEKGLGIRWYAVLFAFATILSTAFFLPGVQSNSIAISVENAFNVPVWITGLVICGFLALIIFGGVKRIGKVAQIVVPFMAAAYIIMAIIIMAMNFTEIPGVIKLIITSAFNAEATFGGIFGMAISWGIKRGIYSNEAGQGTAPHAAAAAEVSHPVKQGLVQAFSVYVDTLFICTATAFMILFTGQYNVINPEGGFLVENLPGVTYGPEFTQYAISEHFPNLGAGFIAISLAFFAFTTIMAYYYIAETNLSFLQKDQHRDWPLFALRALLLIATFYGTVRTAELAWTLGDIGVGIMAWLNMIAIILLRKPAMAALKDYVDQRKKGLDPTFDSNSLDIKNIKEWDKIN